MPIGETKRSCYKEGAMISFKEILKEYPELFSSIPHVSYWAKKANPSEDFAFFTKPNGRREQRLTNEQFKKTISLRQSNYRPIIVRKNTEFDRILSLLKEERIYLTKAEIINKYSVSINVLNQLFYKLNQRGLLLKKRNRKKRGKILTYLIKRH